MGRGRSAHSLAEQRTVGTPTAGSPKGGPMTVTLSTRDALLAQIPDLRASAFLLCGSKDRADDLVQDTVLSAWAHLDDFQAGTNMGAWLFTILRNRFRTEYRKSRRWVQDVDGRYAERLTSKP